MRTDRHDHRNHSGGGTVTAARAQCGSHTPSEHNWTGRDPSRTAKHGHQHSILDLHLESSSWSPNANMLAPGHRDTTAPGRPVPTPNSTRERVPAATPTPPAPASSVAGPHHRPQRRCTPHPIGGSGSRPTRRCRSGGLGPSERPRGRSIAHMLTTLTHVHTGKQTFTLKTK